MVTKAELYSERRQALQGVVRQAIGGTLEPLFQRLARGSGLPGVQPNQALLEEFGGIVAQEDKKQVGKLLITMATFDPDQAVGGTAFEFIPICGVRGLGEWASHHSSVVSKAVDVLHACAEDVRFRVRQEVPDALSRIGEAVGDGLLPHMTPWMDGLFHASAVLRALARDRWLVALHAGDEVVEIMNAAFETARDAPRSSMRSPGYKDLIEALTFVPAEIAHRFGVIVLDRMAVWSSTKEPKLREAISQNLRSTRLIARHAVDLEKVRAALESSRPVHRDPTTYVGPTRARGRKTSRRA